MSNREEINFTRRVLDFLTEIDDALQDVTGAMAGEDLVSAKRHLVKIRNSADAAIEALTPKET